MTNCHKFVEFLFEILCVGAPPQLAHYCKLTLRQFLCWNPANYCLYNIVVLRTLCLIKTGFRDEYTRIIFNM
ncbi:TPA: hypothetical protein I2T40_00560 [Staphylococcus aureus]|nr:hypothetical protein [Staphylococcus aureus]